MTSTDSRTTVAQAAIVAQHLSKVVDDAHSPLTLLDNVNLRVGSATSLAIVGPSGSGKSTLLGLLAGLDLPSSGRVWIDGIDLFALSEDGRAALRARKFGFVFQNFQLIGHLNALENVTLAMEISGQTGALRADAQVMLERVGLGARLRHMPATLSGGEQQRVALARAFATRPSLLLADEPTGNLDAAGGLRIIDLMFSLQRELGTTLVLVTHDNALASRCDAVVELEAGRLVESAAATLVIQTSSEVPA
ncbi:MAG: ATP-binding cassette domain-containing protein [Betaproteobacteria bacterium]|nr:ATP-binding cassette domain-containing protein [Betaproteobacteria bacterium]MDE2124607.1 ATP-binding cassette domain-containing protein [Betaproteobacteria bacterium]MDE2187381.1 ATP-binding cassette domain-containing protein [Betaproteobacteria bacterium]MDE2324520.1 ATP-binding cassette domain-containing protein [Betaproteobacteria bacterium]